MYIPKHFEESRKDVLQRFIREHPLATIIIHGSMGLSADHIPMMLRPLMGPNGRLVGHVSRSNPLWQQAGDGLECLVIFHGMQHYISPNWYASKAETGKVVPTWNYEVVHVRGKIQAINDPVGLRAFLEELTREHEGGLAKPWELVDAPVQYIDQMLQGVVGIQVEIESMVGKAKLSQNQAPANQVSLVEALRGLGDSPSLEMAEAVNGRIGREV